MDNESTFETTEEEMEYKLEFARERAKSDIKKQKSIADHNKKSKSNIIVSTIAYGGVLILLYYATRLFGFY